MNKVVLDTSLFVNPEVRNSLGATPTEAFARFLSLAKDAPSLEFYMPPSIFEELMNFVNRDALSGELLLHLKQKPPSRLEMKLPAMLLYEFVEEMRERVNKGLRVAEKSVRSALQTEQDVLLKDLRRKYRDALREGILDSKEDVDLLLLAYELDAVLVTADNGAVAWAEKLGITWLLPEKFTGFVEAAIREHSGK
ncbi:MAG TPA: RNA ligase partner protein [Nitrospirae bacterium]|nr:RNA ligase partner protein [Nitrospirota bacterium]